MTQTSQPPRHPERFIDASRRIVRLKHYSLRTEQAYVGWIRRFIRENGRRHPCDMDGPKVERFFSVLAIRDDISSCTQNQALSALLFLYRQVLVVELPWLDSVTRAKDRSEFPRYCPRMRYGACYWLWRAAPSSLPACSMEPECA